MKFALALALFFVSISSVAIACENHQQGAKTSSDKLGIASAHAGTVDGNAAAGAKDLASTKFKVDGISCSGCEKMISAKLQALEGVKSVEFYNAKDGASKKTAHFLKVSYVSSSVTHDAIVKAIASAGDHYKATPVLN
jgi:copper chaperone CopZ